MGKLAFVNIFNCDYLHFFPYFKSVPESEDHTCSEPCLDFWKWSNIWLWGGSEVLKLLKIIICWKKYKHRTDSSGQKKKYIVKNKWLIQNLLGIQITKLSRICLAKYIGDYQLLILEIWGFFHLINIELVFWIRDEANTK